MAMREGKYFSLNIGWKQWIGLGVMLAIGFLIIHFDAVIFGYVLAVLALSAFFVVVAFDIGVPKQSVDVEPVEHTESESTGRAA